MDRTGSLLLETKVPRPNIPPQPRRQRPGGKRRVAAVEAPEKLPYSPLHPGCCPHPSWGVGPRPRSPPVARRPSRRLPGSSGRWLPMLCAASGWSPSSAMSVYPQRSLGQGGAGTPGEGLRQAAATLPGHSVPWRLQQGERRHSRELCKRSYRGRNSNRPNAIHTQPRIPGWVLRVHLKQTNLLIHHPLLSGSMERNIRKTHRLFQGELEYSWLLKTISVLI